MKLGDDFVCAIPTIGFNVENIVRHGTTVTFWDVGKSRRLYDASYNDRKLRPMDVG